MYPIHVTKLINLKYTVCVLQRSLFHIFISAVDVRPPALFWSPHVLFTARLFSSSHLTNCKWYNEFVKDMHGEITDCCCHCLTNVTAHKVFNMESAGTLQHADVQSNDFARWHLSLSLLLTMITSVDSFSCVIAERWRWWSSFHTAGSSVNSLLYLQVPRLTETLVAVRALVHI